MAELTAPQQNRLLGQLANMLRATEGDIAAPEFLPSQLDVMGLVRQLMLPSAETVEKLSYGDPLFRMPMQSNIPITADREYLADVVGMAPMVPAASRGATRLTNEAADQLVRAITRNPEATAPGVLEAAGEMAPLSRIFVGKKSKSWDKDAEKQFLALEKEGASPAEMWRQTGTIRGPEGKLRQEISDAEARFLVDTEQRQLMKLGKAYSHPELYEAYPGSKYIDFVRTANKDMLPGEGSFSSEVTKYGEMVMKPYSEENARKIAAHELQHYTQDREGFAPGGDPKTVGAIVDDVRFSRIADEYDDLVDKYSAIEANFGKGKLPADVKEYKDAIKTRMDELKKEIRQFSSFEDIATTQDRYQAYKLLGGEAEARLAERRMNLTPEQRRQYFPYTYDPRGEVYGMDVKPEDLLIPYGLLNK